MGLVSVFLKEFDLSPWQISEAERKAVFNVVIVPLVFLALTANILVSVAWIALLSLLYITKISHKKQNADAFFTLLFYVFAGILILALIILILSL